MPGRLLVVGVDGLGPESADDFLEWLPYRGRHVIPRGVSLYTPVLWSGFLLARNPAELGLDEEWARSVKAVRSLHPVVRPLYVLVRRVLGIKATIGARRVLAKLGLVRLAGVDLGRLKRLAWPSSVPDTVCIGFPGFCGDDENEALHRSAIARYVEAPVAGVRAWARSLIELTRRRFSEARRAVLEGRRLILVYTPLPDALFHLRCISKHHAAIAGVALASVKVMVEELARTAVKMGYHVLVLSDHGFEGCEHSRIGWYASSFEAPTETTLWELGRLAASIVKEHMPR